MSAALEPDTRLSTSVIVCGVDDSEPARRAASVAAELSRGLGARLVLVTVAPVETRPGGMPAAGPTHGTGQELLDTLRQQEGIKDAEEEVRIGSPAPSIIEVAADRAAELLVIGTRGRGPLKAAVLGSVSREVMENAPCPVVVVPARPQG